MNRKGVTLIELLVVIGIMSVLLAISTIAFNQWTQRRNLERDVKELYADLLFFRQQSVVRGMRHRAQFLAANIVAFRSYSTEGDAVGTEVRRKTMINNLTTSGWTAPSATEIEFSSRGIMVPVVPNKTLCFNSTIDPAVDAIYLTPMKINLAKIRIQGNGCAKANIDLR